MGFDRGAQKADVVSARARHFIYSQELIAAQKELLRLLDPPE